jgi:hypothetical protein
MNENRMMVLAGIPQKKRLLKEAEEKSFVSPSQTGKLQKLLGYEDGDTIPHGVLHRELEKLKTIVNGGGTLTPVQRNEEELLMVAINAPQSKEDPDIVMARERPTGAGVVELGQTK